MANDPSGGRPSRAKVAFNPNGVVRDARLRIRIPGFERAPAQSSGTLLEVTRNHNRSVTERMRQVCKPGKAPDGVAATRPTYREGRVDLARFQGYANAGFGPI